MSISRALRISVAVAVLAGGSVLSLGCGGDTIGDNFGFDASPGMATDATIPDAGMADTGVQMTPDSGPSCQPGLSECGLDCVDEQSDGTNCGGCGVVCGAGQVCNAGSCALACNGGTMACGTSCINQLTDANNCGGCGNVCAAGQACTAGTCGLSCAPGLTQCGGGANALDAGTGSGTTDAGDAATTVDAGASVCVDTLIDRGNCGGCGITCTVGQVCSAGACAATCQPGLVQCGDTCVDPLTTSAYCGVTTGCAVAPELADGGIDAGGATGVGVACAAGQVCSGGRCQVTCAANQVDCGTKGCIDPLTNGEFCGASGNCTNAGTGNSAGAICPSGEICNGSGVCTVSCQPGQVKCGDTCVDPLTNGNFCGASGNCTNDHGTTVVNGVSESDSAGTSCPAGDVCTTDTNGNGVCQLDCAQGFVKCNGVCIDPHSNANYCGANGACGVGGNGSAGSDCTKMPGTFCNGSGACQTTCTGNEILCGSTCVDPSTNENFCGATGQCGQNGNGSAGSVCTGNQVCSTINGVTGCNTTCAAGDIICNGSCVNPLTDDTFCGAKGTCNAASGANTVGTVCGSVAAGTLGTICTNGSCTASCPTNLTVCGNTCVDEQNDPSNCGKCGAAGGACIPNANVTEDDCVHGACKIGVCAADFADCNGFIEDGCEKNIETDASNCGGCGVACGSGSTCNAGKCAQAPGNGSNGVLSVNGATTIDTVATTASGTVGTTTVTVGSVAGLAVGQTILLHQTQGGASMGAWEKQTLTAVGTTTVTVGANLAHSYSSSGGAHAQAIVVPQYTSVTVSTTGTLSAPAWNGSTGGILVFEAEGATSVAGTVTMAGQGFRSFHAASCGTHCVDGVSGESAAGGGSSGTASNGAGGGGGFGGGDCGQGGGGAYGGAGAGAGTNQSFSCGRGSQTAAGGAVDGASSLEGAFFFGGAGGEGGYDEDGGQAGLGGFGGGAILIFTQTLSVTGTITDDGGIGGDGSNASCGGGCGMAGGGGGAGGAILLSAFSASLGNNAVHAEGAIGGSCTCNLGTGGPAGGDGRIDLSATSSSGTTQPTFTSF